MLHEQNKTTKIVAEVSMYLFYLGATEIESKIKIRENEAIICLKSDYNAAFQNKFTSALRLLSKPRDEALENEFWSLAGSTEIGEASQLLLVGSMTDKADLSFDETTVTITLTRRL